MSNADDVLAELKSIGALGRPKTAVVLPRVGGVDVEEAAPEAPLVDQRGEVMIGLLSDALTHLDSVAEGLTELRNDLAAIRRVWTTDPVEAPESPREVLVRPEEVVAATEPVAAPEPPSEPSQPEIGEEERQAVLEAARRKIRGEDLTPDQRAKAWAEEEASIPAVGEDRARPEVDSGEITIRTVGTVKPSFPAEE